MSKNNVRIAIRDSTDSHNVAFFDNKAGIKYKSANLHRFLAGSASILTIKYNSKDIDTIRSGCKLAFRYKNRDYWLNVMNFEKKGFEVELTAYSLGLELNNETRGEHKPANAMSIAEYVAYYNPEHALTIGVNEVSDKRIKLEWTGTDTILARLFSVANSFGAELDFNVELNDDYSLKRQVLNIYKKGNLGTNKVSQPVRVGKELKVINYSDNIKELRTAVRATGKDGLTIDGLNKKIYDSNKQLLYYSSGMTVYAPQSRDRFPSVGKGSNDNWIVEDLGETQYETKEALWGYMYGEIQKKSVPEITYEVEGAIEAGIGDTQTLIDDIHFEPPLYVQARVSELEDDILTGKVTKSTFINFERKYSQIADVLLKQVEALAEDAAPYIIRLSTNNGYIFKNGEGSSTITARLEKYSKDIAATWKWVVDNKVVGTGDKLTVKAEQVTNTMAVAVIAYVNGNEVVRDYMTFSNSDDGVGVESIDRYFTSSDQSDGVTIEGAQWSDKPPAPTEDGKYLWAYDEITYTDGTVTTTKPAAVGANFDVDAFRAEIAEDLKDVPNREEFENKIAEELANSKAEIETQIETAKTQAESNAKEYADTINQETSKVAELANAAAGEIKADLVNVKNNLTDTSLVANNAQAAVDAAKQDLANVTSDLNTAKQNLANSVDAVNNKVDSAKAELTQTKQQLTNVANDLSQAKTDLQTAVSEVDTKTANLKSELSKTKQDLTSQAQQLQAQANAQSELTKRVSSVEKTANGTKTTVSELSKTVAQNGKDITSVTNRTKTVEDDLANTKTTLTQVQTTANSASQKTATLETGLNGLSAKFSNLKIGGTNLLLYSADPWQAPKDYYDLTGATKTDETLNGSIVYKTCTAWTRLRMNFGKHLIDRKNVKVGDEFTYSVYVRTDQETPIKTMLFFRYSDSTSQKMTGGETITQEWQKLSFTFKVTQKMLSDSSKLSWVGFEQTSNSEDGKFVYYACNKLERGNIATDYSLAPEDTIEEINAVSSELKQTQDGITLLATKTELNSAKNELQSGINTATNKANSAQSTANNNAQTISTHTTQISALNTGLQAKVSQTDFNTLSGRVTTAENNITAKANELSSKITSVEGKIPTSIGGRNLWIQSKVTGGFIEETLPDNHITGQKKCYRIPNDQQLYFNIEPDFSPRLYQKVTFSAWVKYENVVQGSNDWNVFNCFKHELVRKNSSTGATTGTDFLALEGFTGTSDWKRITYTYDYSANKSYNQLKTGIFFNIENARSGTAWVTGVKIEIGSIPSDYSPAPEDYDSKLAAAQSEFKQTTDAIKASVSSLDSSTVKSSTLTINADGIVMKAGKTTTDVANAIGSYFSVNQNAINLFSDKINVKGNMIVSGAITSDKIASKSINTAHLNGKIITADVISSNAVTADAIKAGAVTTDKMSANSINGDRIAAGTLDAAKIKVGSITASQIASGTITSAQIKAETIRAVNIAAGAITGDKIQANSVDVSKISGLDANFIKSKVEYAMIDWLKGKTIVADNGATKIDLLSGYINFDSDTPSIRRVTPGIPTQFIKFLKSDINSVTTIGSNRDGSESSMNDSFAGIKITSGDLIEQTEIISDQIYFLTGAANPQGWQMSTVSGGDHRQITLFPSGNPTKSNIYASDYFIRGSNGWVNLLDFINYFNVCLGHLQNLTGRYDIFKPFKI